MPPKVTVNVKISEFGNFTFNDKYRTPVEKSEVLIERIPYAFPSNTNDDSRFILLNES